MIIAPVFVFSQLLLQWTECMLIKYWETRQKSYLFLNRQNSCLTCLFVSLPSKAQKNNKCPNEYLNKREMVEKLEQMWKTVNDQNSSQAGMLTSDVPMPLLSWRSESGFVHVIFFCQWDISKHDRDACALGIALFLLYETLQLPPCVWAQANLLDERNVSSTFTDTVPPVRHGSKACKTNWSTNHQTCEWGQPFSANLTQKSCPESPKYHERSL